MTRQRPVGDLPDALDELRIGAHDVGAWGAVDHRRARVPAREFPPGFHGAAPGPSHDEPVAAAAPVRRRAAAVTGKPAAGKGRRA